MRSGCQKQLSKSSRKKKLSKEAQQALLRAYGLQPKEEKSCWLAGVMHPYSLIYRHLRHRWCNMTQWMKSLFLTLLR